MVIIHIFVFYLIQPLFTYFYELVLFFQPLFSNACLDRLKFAVVDNIGFSSFFCCHWRFSVSWFNQKTNFSLHCNIVILYCKIVFLLFSALFLLDIWRLLKYLQLYFLQTHHKKHFSCISWRMQIPKRFHICWMLFFLKEIQSRRRKC